MKRYSRIFGVCLFVFWVIFIRINVSPSVPVGLYWTHAVPASVERGMLVLVSVEGWSHRFLPFLKPVVGVAGDRACVIDGQLRIHYRIPQDGRLVSRGYGEVLTDDHGHPLPQVIEPNACTTIPEGFVFLASDTPRSLDSRYFGLIPLTQLRAIATPLVTW